MSVPPSSYRSPPAPKSSGNRGEGRWHRLAMQPSMLSVGGLNQYPCSCFNDNATEASPPSSDRSLPIPVLLAATSSCQICPCC